MALFAGANKSYHRQPLQGEEKRKVGRAMTSHSGTYDVQAEDLWKHIKNKAQAENLKIISEREDQYIRIGINHMRFGFHDFTLLKVEPNRCAVAIKVVSGRPSSLGNTAEEEAMIRTDIAVIERFIESHRQASRSSATVELPHQQTSLAVIEKVDVPPAPKPIENVDVPQVPKLIEKADVPSVSRLAENTEIPSISRYTITKWEYSFIRVVVIKGDQIVTEINDQVLDFKRDPSGPYWVLNQMGRDGWELAQVIEVLSPSSTAIAPRGMWDYILKRPSITTLGGYGPGRWGRLVARRWAWAAA
jgi:hypothetical protein